VRTVGPFAISERAEGHEAMTRAPAERTFRGVRLPALLYGTAWKEERTANLVRAALGQGFRGIDTANQRRHYFEAAVGEAVAAAIAGGEITRGDLFLQTKFTYAAGQDHRLPYDPRAPLAEQVRQSLASSLEHLRTDYVDSYLLHGPSRRDGLGPADEEVWRAMEELQRAGRTRLIGVSNVTAAQLAALHARAAVKPAFVQNRCYARDGWDRDVRAFCRAHEIVYQGFSLLTANTRELALPAVRGVIARARRSTGPVVFRFAMQVGMVPLTGTSNEDHMREDLACLEIELSGADLRTIETAGARN